MILEPGVQLVVEQLPRLQDVVPVAEDQVGQPVVELLDLRDLRLPQKHRESLDLTRHREILISQVMRLALDDFTFFCYERVDFRIGVYEGPEILTKGFGCLSCLNINISS